MSDQTDKCQKRPKDIQDFLVIEEEDDIGENHTQELADKIQFEYSNNLTIFSTCGYANKMTDLSIAIVKPEVEAGVKIREVALVPQCHLIDQTWRIRKSPSKMPVSSPQLRKS